ncbi:hypothetical protein SH528x_002138 [Novipirellula sp. SH528]|uniref:hypothetical protein n=1 Tax=Novipirellula sp. SH528 TaxID=3454466 RepID=UPI003FA0DB8E
MFIPHPDGGEPSDGDGAAESCFFDCLQVFPRRPHIVNVRRLNVMLDSRGHLADRVRANVMAAPFNPPAEINADPMPETPTLRRGKRVLATIGALLLVYTLTYVMLRNRGIRQMETYDNVGILYTDVESTFQRKDLTMHLILSALFAPANELDRIFFGGEPPIRCIIFDLA